MEISKVLQKYNLAVQAMSDGKIPDERAELTPIYQQFRFSDSLSRNGLPIYIVLTILGLFLISGPIINLESVKLANEACVMRGGLNCQDTSTEALKFAIGLGLIILVIFLKLIANKRTDRAMTLEKRLEKIHIP